MESGSYRSAVDAFGEWHEQRGIHEAALSRYSTLLPAAPPGPGEQYRFEVDLDRCTGCKACVAACHSLNGLEADETWRNVGLLVGGGDESVPIWQQHVTTACHHCVEPACLAGCPVDAYEKDPITGIVAHLDDQCIGCRYCQLTCPYEVPSFSKRLGVVRKCDMCSDRLAEGEAPACVQGCPTSAISIGVVSTVELMIDSELVDPGAEPARVVPTAPVSSLTTPATLYRTSRPIPVDAVAADDHRIVPAHNHVPLVAMLVLTQLSVGAFTVEQIVHAFAGSARSVSPGPVPALVAWMSALLAIGASVLHLGRPLVAWRAVLGLRHSWLSREIVAFGGYAAAGGATAAAALGVLPDGWAAPLGWATVLVGFGGVWCSAKLYAVTGRPWWRLDRTLFRFVYTMATTGPAAVALAWSLAALGSSERRSTARSVAGWSALVIGLSLLVAGIGLVWFLIVTRRSGGAIGRSSWLLRHTLRATLVRSAAALGVAALLSCAAAVGGPSPGVAAVWWSVVLVATVLSSWWERSLFFTASAPDRMPGAFH